MSDDKLVERAISIVEDGDVDISTGLGTFTADERDTILRALQSERASMEGEIERLREALKPFAAYADDRNVMPPSLPITNGSGMAKRQLTMADCYEARAALTSSKTGDEA